MMRTVASFSSGSKTWRRATACSEPTTSSSDGWARLIQRSLRTAPGFSVSVSAVPSPTHFLRTGAIGSVASEAAWSSSTRRFSAWTEPLHARPRGWWVVRATSATPAYPHPSCRSTSGSVRWFSIRASTLRPSCVAPSVICTRMPSRTWVVMTCASDGPPQPVATRASSSPSGRRRILVASAAPAARFTNPGQTADATTRSRRCAGRPCGGPSGACPRGCSRRARRRARRPGCGRR